MKKRAARRARTLDPVSAQVSADTLVMRQKKGNQARSTRWRPMSTVMQVCYGSLTRLDQRLTAAVEAAERMFAARAAGDLYRDYGHFCGRCRRGIRSYARRAVFFRKLTIARHCQKLTNSLSLRRLLWLQRVYRLHGLRCGYHPHRACAGDRPALRADLRVSARRRHAATPWHRPHAQPSATGGGKAAAARTIQRPMHHCFTIA